MTGRADLVVKASEIKELHPERKNYWDWTDAHIVFKARVTEEISQITLEGSAETKIEHERYKLEFLSNTPENYKPGLLFTGFVS